MSFGADVGGEFLDAHQNDEDRRAGRLPCFEVAMRLHGILQRVALVDLDLDPAAGDMVEQGARTVRHARPDRRCKSASAGRVK